MRRAWWATACAFAILSATAAQAHQFTPALLELREDAAVVRVRWKEPAVRVQGSRLRPVLPAGCVGVGEPSVRRGETGMEAEWQISCPAGLPGETVGVEGIATSGANVLVRVELADGRLLNHVLTADADSYRIPETPGRLGVAATYGKLGFDHILAGYDHLLFILGLTVLVGFGRRLAWTITAFTAGHSVTLGLAVLGFVHVSPRLVEAGIAASLYFLALELTGLPRRSLLRAYPWAIAFLFGLLHGLGFAGALTEIGLPSGEIPLALFAFNVGIEIGQLLLVAVVLAAGVVLGSVAAFRRRWLRLAPAYAIGSLAVFWLLERV